MAQFVWYIWDKWASRWRSEYSRNFILEFVARCACMTHKIIVAVIIPYPILLEVNVSRIMYLIPDLSRDLYMGRNPSSYSIVPRISCWCRGGCSWGWRGRLWVTCTKCVERWTRICIWLSCGRMSWRCVKGFYLSFVILSVSLNKEKIDP